MLDKWTYPLWYRLANRIVFYLDRKKVQAWYLTLLSVIATMICVLLICVQQTYIALIFLIISRICDGLDGPLARKSGKMHPSGALMDNISDFIFYGAIIVAFTINNEKNMIAGIFLLLSFYITGGSFLAQAAILSEQKRRKEIPKIQKGFIYGFGLMEGTETIVFFLLFLLFPDNFSVLAWIFSVLCIFTLFIRIWQVRKWSF